MKILLFGDGPQLKKKGKALREQNGWTVHLRSIARWAGDVETTVAVYFLTPAEAIRTAYKERGIECFLVEEPEAEADAPDASNGEADAASGAEGGDGATAPQGSAEGGADKPSDTTARRSSAKKAK